MIGASLYNREVQVEHLYIKQRSNELNFAPDSRRVQQAEPCGVEPQKTAGPAGAQAEILRVEANSGLIMIADANGERFGDRAIRKSQR